jgi:hypothetical protein
MVDFKISSCVFFYQIRHGKIHEARRREAHPVLLAALWQVNLLSRQGFD